MLLTPLLSLRAANANLRAGSKLMNDFEKFLQLLKSSLIDLAKEAGRDIKEELLQDGSAFVRKTRGDLQRWTALLAEGRLTKDEFAYLLEAKKDLAEMEALKQKGLAEVRIDELKQSIFDAIIGSATRVFL